MTRQVLIVIGVALLSAAGFAAVLGVVWLVAHLVLGVFPYVLASRLEAMAGVLPVLFILVAFVGAACAAASLAAGHKREEDMQAHPRA